MKKFLENLISGLIFSLAPTLIYLTTFHPTAKEELKYHLIKAGVVYTTSTAVITTINHYISQRKQRES